MSKSFRLFLFLPARLSRFGGSLFSLSRSHFRFAAVPYNSTHHQPRLSTIDDLRKEKTQHGNKNCYSRSGTASPR